MPPITSPVPKKQCSGSGGYARSAPFHPRAAKRSAQTQQHQRRREGGVRGTEPPASSGKEGLDGAVEGAPRIDRADADVTATAPTGISQRLKTAVRVSTKEGGLVMGKIPVSG